MLSCVSQVLCKDCSPAYVPESTYVFSLSCERFFEPIRTSNLFFLNSCTIEQVMCIRAFYMTIDIIFIAWTAAQKNIKNRHDLDLNTLMLRRSMIS